MAKYGWRSLQNACRFHGLSVTPYLRYQKDSRYCLMRAPLVRLFLLKLGGIIRHVEFTAYLDLEVAERLQKWLGDKIAQIRELQK